MHNKCSLNGGHRSRGKSFLSPWPCRSWRSPLSLHPYPVGIWNNLKWALRSIPPSVGCRVPLRTLQTSFASLTSLSRCLIVLWLEFRPGFQMSSSLNGGSSMASDIRPRPHSDDNKGYYYPIHLLLTLIITCIPFTGSDGSRMRLTLIADFITQRRRWLWWRWMMESPSPPQIPFLSVQLGLRTNGRRRGEARTA